MPAAFFSTSHDEGLAKMKQRVKIRVVAGVVTALALGLVASAPASAATVQRAPSRTVKVHSWDDYRTTIVPSGFSIPKGNVLVSKAVTVKKGTKTVAKNRASYRAAAGTYSTSSTFKYRTRTAVRTTVTKSGITDDVEYCTVASAEVVSYDEAWSEADVQYSGTCRGTYWDWSDDNLRSVTGTGKAVWMNHEYPSDGTPEYAPGQDMYDPVVLLKISWQEPKTVYRYGPTKTAVVTRTVKVVKVPNAPQVTFAEFRMIDVDWDDPEEYGSSKSQVHKIFGTAGTRRSYSVYGNGDVIEFRQYKGTNGARVTVGYFNGYAYSASWRS